MGLVIREHQGRTKLPGSICQACASKCTSKAHNLLFLFVWAADGVSCNDLWVLDSNTRQIHEKRLIVRNFDSCQFILSKLGAAYQLCRAGQKQELNCRLSGCMTDYQRRKTEIESSAKLLHQLPAEQVWVTNKKKGYVDHPTASYTMNLDREQ
jgi:hypothetical protein